MKFAISFLLFLTILIATSQADENLIARFSFESGDGYPSEVAKGLRSIPAAWHGMERRYGFDPETGTAFVVTAELPQPPEEWKTDPGKYLEITLEAQPGHTIDLDQIRFKFGGTNRSENSRGVTTELRSSADDFSSTLFVGEQSRISIPQHTTEPILMDFEVPLSGAEFKNQQKIQFRFYPAVSGRGILINARYGSIIFIGNLKKN